jgi:peptidyl-prolyl cis-trans isomerase C
MTVLFKTVVFLFLFSPVGVFCQEKLSAGSDVAAEVGNRQISAEEFQNILTHKRLRGDTKQILQTLTPEGKDQILNALVEIMLLSIEAKKRKIDEEPKVRLLIQNATDKILAEALVQRQIDELDLRDAILKKFYDNNAELFTTSPRIKARHINTRTEEEAQAALKEIMNGRDFIEVATERNIDSSKSKGGDLGWVKKGVMVKPFEDALFSLKKGQTSDIIKTSFGYHIIKVEEIEKGKIRPFDTVREEIKKRLIENHISQFKEDLKKKYPIYINTELLQKTDR